MTRTLHRVGSVSLAVVLALALTLVGLPSFAAAQTEDPNKTQVTYPTWQRWDAVISTELFRLVRQEPDEILFPSERWAATFRSHAQLILHKLGEYLDYSPPLLLERLIEDADPPATTDLTRDARYRYATEV